MSTFRGSYPTFTQLPVIDGTASAVGDTAYTMDDGSMWWAKQPSAPPGANPLWTYVDTIRGSSGPEGPPGVGIPGPQGQIGPQGLHGAQGPQGPAGRNSFSYLSQRMTIAALGVTVTQSVSDTSWMSAGQLLYIPGAGTFSVVGTPSDPHVVTLANSGDASNAPVGTQISAGTLISPANMRGPVGPSGPVGPQGLPGPQGVGGASAYTTLKNDFTVPAAQGIAFVIDASAFSIGLIVYVGGGGYFSVVARDTVANTLTLQNQGWAGSAPVGTVITAGTTVSGTGPQGPQGIQGPMGPQGPQGLIGVAPTGTIAMYGAVTPPAGWLICDGTAVSRTQYSNLFSIISTGYGTGDGSSTFNLPNLQGRFALGSSGTHALATTGGEETHTLTVAELAVHAHTLTDPGHVHPDPGHGHTGYTDAHNHTLHDPWHGHGVNDPQHKHQSYYMPNALGVSGGGNQPFITGGAYRDTTFSPTGITIASSPTGIWIDGVGALGVAVYGNVTGIQSTQTNISMASAGSGAAHNNLPPFQTVQYIIKV